MPLIPFVGPRGLPAPDSLEELVDDRHRQVGRDRALGPALLRRHQLVIAVDDLLGRDGLSAPVPPWLPIVAERDLLLGELEIPAAERRTVERLRGVRNGRPPFSEEV